MEKVEGDKATVRITSFSACSACKSKEFCTMSEMKEKFVEVQLKENQEVKDGDNVNVVIAQKQGDMAVILAYAIPIIIFIGLLIGATALHTSELMAGIIALAGIGAYFLILRLFKNKIEGKFMFYIK
ncbi:MAG: SoxR reducing system RseC family protein [Bacteroidota bacterium]|nr:SoxR reducing system RseC family protein [Bacteroidota bacterium]